MSSALPSILWWSSEMCDRRQHDDEFAPGLILESDSLFFLATDQGWQVLNGLPSDARRLVLDIEPAWESAQAVNLFVHLGDGDRSFLWAPRADVRVAYDDSQGEMRIRGTGWNRQQIDGREQSGEPG